MSQPVLLLLGYGPNIGHAVATRFAAQGYKVAIASRSLQDERTNEAGWMQLHVDLSYPERVPEVFSKVVDKFGIPSVVVYNGKGRTAQSLVPCTRLKLRPCRRNPQRTPTNRPIVSERSPRRGTSHPRIQYQRSQRSDCCTASRGGFQAAASICITDIHFHGECIERDNDPASLDIRNGQEGCNLYGGSGQYGISGSWVQVCEVSRQPFLTFSSLPL